MTGPDTPLVLSECDARGVHTLTLNRPQAFNALSEGMLAALQAELDRIAADDSARVLVIAAAGKAFCAGHDLKEMRAEPSLAYYQRLFDQCGRVMMSVQKLPIPVIARVQGIATAAGCQLVAMCDLAVASRDARFAVSGINVGLFCSTPSVALSRNLSRKAAFEMLVTGAFISADEALAKGLVNRVADATRLDDEVAVAGEQHRRQAACRDPAGQTTLLPADRGRHRSRVCGCQPDHGLQHDGAQRARRRAGLHRSVERRATLPTGPTGP